MPDPNPPSDRTPAERQADHEGLGRLASSLVPALVQKLNGSALGELEVREGEWRIRLRRPQAGATHPRRERARAGHAIGERRTTLPASASFGAAVASEALDDRRAVATSPAVGIFRAVAAPGDPVRAGDRIAVVDLLGVAQEVVAPIDGVVVELLSETGEAVEYGEDLVVLEASHELDASDGSEAGDGTGGAG